MLNVIMPNVTYKPFMLSVIMLSVVMLNVIMLSVVAPRIIMQSAIFSFQALAFAVFSRKFNLNFVYQHVTITKDLPV